MMNWTADFPILAADENGNRLVYLDSAATAQRPQCVLDPAPHPGSERGGQLLY